MVILDNYIEECFANHFECPEQIFYSRDTDIEEILLNAGKVEYTLKTDISKCMEAFGCKSVEELKEYGIEADDHGFRRTIKNFKQDVFLDDYQKVGDFFSFEIIKAYLSYRKEKLSKRTLCELDIQKIESHSKFKIVNNEHPLFQTSAPNAFGIDNFFTKYSEDKKTKLIIPFLAIGRKYAKSSFDRISPKENPLSNFYRSILPIDVDNIKGNIPLRSIRKQKNSIIILTDSMELAVHNQNKFGSRRELIFAWHYWYGGRRAIPQIDFSSIVGKKVYYLCINHSGFDTEYTLHNAELVSRKLKSEGAESVKFISYLHDKSYTVPRIFDSARSLKNGAVKKVQISDFSKFKKKYISQIRDRKAIVTPVILDRTFTIAYGAKGALNTWFVQLLGLAGLLGRRAVEDWGCKQKVKKLVFCYKDEFYSENHYLENIDYMFRVLTGRKPVKNNYGNKLKAVDFLTGNSIELYSLRSVKDASAFILESTREPKILVLDGFEIDPDELVDIESTIRALIRSGWTVILSIQTSKHFNSAEVRKISADSYLEIKQLNFTQNKLIFSVSTDTILRAFKRPNTFKCEFDFGFDPPTLRKLPLSKSELEKLRNEIFSMRARKTSWKEIARVLDISINKATRFSPGIIDRL